MVMRSSVIERLAKIANVSITQHLIIRALKIAGISRYLPLFHVD